MIRRLWYAVLESKELRDEPLGLTRMGERMVFWRDASGKSVCLYDRCAHRGASLAPPPFFEDLIPGDHPIMEFRTRRIEFRGSGEAKA